MLLTEWIRVCLQCFDTVGWASGRAPGLWKLNDEVLVWLSVWSEVHTVCMWWSSQCHCCLKIPSALASFKSTLVLTFWFRLTQVVLVKRLFNKCSSREITGFPSKFTKFVLCQIYLPPPLRRYCCKFRTLCFCGYCSVLGYLDIFCCHFLIVGSP